MQTTHDPDYIDDDADAQQDAWCDGYFAHQEGKPCPSGEYEAKGWEYRRDAQLDRVVYAMPARPEGYYHSAPGAFD